MECEGDVGTEEIFEHHTGKCIAVIMPSFFVLWIVLIAYGSGFQPVGCGPFGSFISDIYIMIHHSSKLELCSSNEVILWNHHNFRNVIKGLQH